MAAGPKPSASPQIVFGPFEYDETAGSLYKHGIRIRLQGQPLLILSMLLRRSGQVVTREEFQCELWQGDAFGDFEQGLNAAMNRLRRTLGDSAEHPHYVETLPGRGYRFIAPVHVVLLQPALPVLASDPPVPANRHSLKWGVRQWLALAAALVAAIAGGYWAGHQNGAAHQNLISQQPLRFTSRPGVETMPAFSPDGRQVAYVYSERDPLALHTLGRQIAQANIYVKLIGAGTELRVTNHPGADYHPAWSPDGEYLAFYKDAPGSSGYYIVSALGGEERQITEEQARSGGIAWFPQGRRFVVSQIYEGSRSSPLLEIAAETGKRRQLTFPPTGTLGDAWPAFSPDGKILAFTRIKGGGSFDLCFLPVPELGAVQCRSLDASLPSGLTWTAAGDRLIGSSMIKMAPRLWSYDLRSATLSMLTSGGEVAEYPAMSRQGTLAYVISTRRASIWKLDLKASLQKTGEGKRIAASSSMESDPAFSPDARKIAFVSVRGGSPEIWVTAIDTQLSTQLTHFGGFSQGSPAWSPDGRHIAFDSAENSGAQIYVIAADGGAPRKITVTPGENVVPSWSRDGRYVYFSSDRNGDFQVWKCLAETGETRANAASQVTQNGGFRAFESVDGNYLFYAKGRGKPGLWRRELRSGSGIEEPVLDSLQQWGWWALGSDFIYFLELPNVANPKVQLRVMNIKSHQVNQLAQLTFPVMSITPALAIS